MRPKYTAAENALRRELKSQISSADNEITKGRLRQSLQRIREEASERAKTHLAARAQKAADATAPKREDFSTEQEFKEAVELHRLELDEQSCFEKLDAATSSFRTRAMARNRLKQIADRKKQIACSKSESEECPSIPAVESELRFEIENGRLVAADKLSDFEINHKIGVLNFALSLTPDSTNPDTLRCDERLKKELAILVDEKQRRSA
jgi:hypothetical protein